MARAFAGTMGYLGMTITLLRGVRAGAGIETTMLVAVAVMIAMAAAGAVVGAIAQATIDESVRKQLEKQISGETSD